MQHGAPYQAHLALLVMVVKQAEQPTMEMTYLDLAQCGERQLAVVVVLERMKKLAAWLAGHAMAELRKLVWFVAELVEWLDYRAVRPARLMVLPPIAASLHSSAYALQAIHQGRTTRRQLRLHLLGAPLRLPAGWVVAH